MPETTLRDVLCDPLPHEEDTIIILLFASQESVALRGLVTCHPQVFRFEAGIQTQAGASPHCVP